MVRLLRASSTSYGLVVAATIILLSRCNAFITPIRQSLPIIKVSTSLYGKKRKGNTPGPNYKKQNSQPKQQEKASVKEARFDAATRQFMFTLVGLSKTLPDKSKDILKNINLSFYPGAKIGVVGLNGSGKSTLLKIMAGIDKEYDGLARPLPGASIGYLPQEPVLEFDTVQECIDDAVSSSRAILDEYNELSMSMADPNIDDEKMNSVMSQLESIGDKIEALDLWELDRTVERAMDSLRCPPGDAKTAVLSGGEKRRVSLCQLLLGSHDMLLLDEVCRCYVISVSYFWFLTLSLLLSTPLLLPSMTTQHSLPITWMPSQSRGWNNFSTSLKVQLFALLMTGKSALVLFCCVV